jgi:hypothetical protein
VLPKIQLNPLDVTQWLKMCGRMGQIKRVNPVIEMPFKARLFVNKALHLVSDACNVNPSTCDKRRRQASRFIVASDCD